MPGKPWYAYVYALTHQDKILYIGKGTTNRLRRQRRDFNLSGHELARFKTEKDAYNFERKAIGEFLPPLNRHQGGNGSFSTPPKPARLTKVLKAIEAIGSKAYAARLVLAYKKQRHIPMDPKTELQLHAVAYGVEWV